MALKTFWALAENLSSSNGPEIIEAHRFYRYKPGRICVRFKPKTTFFVKTDEFGLIIGENIVKHHFYALNGTYTALIRYSNLTE